MSSFVWGTVTAVSPLRVRLDGDVDALAFTPESLIDPAALAVDDRVRVEVSRRRVLIHGMAGGSPVVERIPAGHIGHTARSSAPAGWLLCDGSNVSRATYADLFDAIGTTYGAGDGSTTFGLPNVKGRSIVHRDSGQTEFDTLGETGGAKTVAHSHPLSDAAYALIRLATGSPNLSARRITVPSWTSDLTGGLNSPANTASATTLGTPLDGDTDSASVSVLSPYIVFNCIIKT